MHLGAFVLFKAAFAAVAGVVTSVVASLVAIGAEKPVDSSDPRWCRDPARPTGGAVYPFDHFDKGALAVTDNARGCSCTPTWQLIVEGNLDPAHVRQALSDLVLRYPVLATKVQSLDGVALWASRFRYAHDGSFRVDDIFRVVDVPDAPALEALAREEKNRPLDLFRDFPVTLTYARTGRNGCRLLFRQHHAIADGRAFIGLLGDFARYLDAARAGRRPAPAELAPIGRLPEVDGLRYSPLKLATETAAGVLSLTRRWTSTRLKPLVVMLQNRSAAYTGDNGTVHWVVPDAMLERWKETRQRLGVTMNALLTGALFLALQRWHQTLGLPLGRTRIMVLMETRPRDLSSFVSFANHLAMPEMDVPLDRVTDPKAIIQLVQAQAEAERRSHTAIRQSLCEALLIRDMPLADMQTIAFESKAPTANLTFSNLIPLAFPTVGGDGWRVRQILITTPVSPKVGMTLTVIRYHGELVFNFNYKASAATRDQATALAKEFEKALAEISGIPAPGTWC
jgi:hypothetical protein